MSLWPVWASNQGSIWAGEECSAIDDDDDDENNYIDDNARDYNGDYGDREGHNDKQITMIFISINPTIIKISGPPLGSTLFRPDIRLVTASQTSSMISLHRHPFLPHHLPQRTPASYLKTITITITITNHPLHRKVILKV